MAVYAPVLAGAGIIGGAAYGIRRYIQERHPHVRSEKLAWAKDHELVIEEHLQQTLWPLLEKFPEGSKIKLCFLFINEGDAFEYEHWFLTNGTWYLEFGNGNGLTGHKVTMHANHKSNYLTSNTLRVDTAMRDRMAEVVGATNYSFLLRNCEHVANYVALGRWVSMQTVREGRISKRLLEFVTDKQHLALRNLLPKELRSATISAGRQFNANKRGHVQYSCTQQVLDANDQEAYNVVFLGPTGSGKSTLINLLFNKHVAPTSDEADSDVLSCTRNMLFYSGQGDCIAIDRRNGFTKKTRNINLIDAIGFCDSEMSADEVYRLTKEQIEGNCMRVHRVVVCTSGRIEHHHAEAIKQFLSWLNYEAYKGPGKMDPVVFVYTKCDANPKDSAERRAANLTQMADRLGARVQPTHLPRHSTFNSTSESKFIDINIAVGFPPESDVLSSADYKKLGDVLFGLPMIHFNIDRSWCSIL